MNIQFSFKPFFTFLLLDLKIRQKNETFSRKLFAQLPDKLFQQGAYNQTLHYVKCQPAIERLSTNIFDTMKLKVLFLLNYESPKYIAKLFSLIIFYWHSFETSFIFQQCGILTCLDSNEPDLCTYLLWLIFLGIMGEAKLFSGICGAKAKYF